MRIFFTGLFVLTVAASPTFAQAISKDARDFFESKIRPVLVEQCYECHSSTSGKAKGGLKLDSRDALHRGGDGGAAVVPRSIDKSLLYQAITYDGDYQMPPKGKLPDAVIADFRRWIEMGAPDPRVTEVQEDVASEIDIEQGRQYWAYQPLARPTDPQVSEAAWNRTGIDRFVHEKRMQQNVMPVAEATPHDLVRRLYFVIIGLPPSPEEIDDWTTRLDEASDEQQRKMLIAELVDQLLASPRYGERWGRHWMDVARFAESTGGDQNNIFQHAWRYRDYVIDSFNADKPYDQFIREQIAGDLLPIADDQEWANNIVATGFLALGTKLVGEEDQQKYFADLVDEQIDTTTRTFLATSVACARCHDHKFDPIPQADYYALAGIFRSTETHYGLLKAQARQATTLLDLSGMGVPAGRPNLDRQQYEDLVRQRDEAKQVVEDAMRKIRSGENVFRGTLRRIRSQRDEAEAALQSFSDQGEPRVFAMGTQDRDYPLPTRLLVRGEIDKPAQLVPRGVLQVLTPPRKYELPSHTKGSGRLELANWIAWEKNPLTARVMVNRIWHWMFGQGLVRTVDDFGHAGDRPTHPELLDYLAIRYIESGWSTKTLIREIALSRTWQLSAQHDEAAFAVDPDNHLVWRMQPRRLEAEAVRDAMLAAGGNLDLTRPVGTLLRDVGEGNVGQNVFEPTIRAIESDYRSVYLPRVRSVLPEMLELYDAPDAGLVTGAREETSSPLQAMFMMNNPFVQRQATEFAERVADQPPDERITVAYQIALGRSPAPHEVKLAVAFMDALEDAHMSTHDKLVAYCQALLCTAEFVTID